MLSQSPFWTHLTVSPLSKASPGYLGPEYGARRLVSFEVASSMKQKQRKVGAGWSLLSGPLLSATFWALAALPGPGLLERGAAEAEQ